MYIAKTVFFGRGIFENHVLASLMCFLSDSSYGDEFWKISIFRFLENIFWKIVKIMKESWKTHINSVLRALRILKNDSSCIFPPWGWSQIIFWMDKWCFKLKTTLKNDFKKHDFWPEVYGNFEFQILQTRSVWKFRNQNISAQKCHLFYAAGAFWQNKCSKKHETHENF